MRSTSVVGCACRRTRKYSSAPTGVFQLSDVLIGLEGFGDEQQAVASLAVQRAHGGDMACPLLAGEGGVRPREHLDLDGAVRDVIVTERVNERGQHGGLAGARGPVITTASTR
ncbi:MAG: hypothetical protein M3401_19345 [Actinomycetota bacterium]|nr:hypothetical protein [Actinomycetota bacterium]